MAASAALIRLYDISTEKLSKGGSILTVWSDKSAERASELPRERRSWQDLEYVLVPTVSNSIKY
jgi:hypothetical protein